MAGTIRVAYATLSHGMGRPRVACVCVMGAPPVRRSNSYGEIGIEHAAWSKTVRRWSIGMSSCRALTKREAQLRVAESVRVGVRLQENSARSARASGRQRLRRSLRHVGRSNGVAFDEADQLGGGGGGGGPFGALVGRRGCEKSA